MTPGCTGRPRREEEMTFEEWEEVDINLDGKAVVADWKAEREKFIAEIERLRELIAAPDDYLQHLRKTQDRAEKAEARVQELEEAITRIIDCVAKVSVDIHHAEPGEEWFENREKPGGK